MIESLSQKQTDAVAVAKAAQPEATNAESQTQPAGSAGGLTQAEAQRRLTRYGYNDLPEKKRHPLLEFLTHFWGPIPWMIGAAALLSTLAQHWADLIIILVLLLANAVVAFWEKFQAGNAIAVLKANLALKARVKRSGTWIDVGDRGLDPDDDYPDFVLSLARAVPRGEVDRGVAICGSGVGASVAANKTPGMRACLIHETFSAHQGVEDDDLNVICLGGLVVGPALAWELVKTFLAARFSGAVWHRRRLAKVAQLERREAP